MVMWKQGVHCDTVKEAWKTEVEAMKRAERLRWTRLEYVNARRTYEPQGALQKKKVPVLPGLNSASRYICIFLTLVACQFFFVFLFFEE